MNASQRIDFLVKTLQLTPHPEGGFFKETYRSKELIETPVGPRNLTTSIFFLLTSENVSRFHRIKSDEHWYFHEGSPLTIHTLSAQGHATLHLGPIADGYSPHQLVPAEVIFGSTVDEPNCYALVSCVVTPGFDFEDFELLDEKELISQFTEAREIIGKLT